MTSKSVDPEYPDFALARDLYRFDLGPSAERAPLRRPKLNGSKHDMAAKVGGLP
jgi:hypothetical protein